MYPLRPPPSSNALPAILRCWKTWSSRERSRRRVDAADASARAPILDAIRCSPPSPARVAAMPGTLVAQAVERCGAALLPTTGVLAGGGA